MSLFKDKQARKDIATIAEQLKEVRSDVDSCTQIKRNEGTSSWFSPTRRVTAEEVVRRLDSMENSILKLHEYLGVDLEYSPEKTRLVKKTKKSKS